MLIGEHRHSLDSKNRIIIPTKLRTELGNPFILTKGLDGCIYVFPMSEWEKYNEKLLKLSEYKDDARKFTRFFSSGAAVVEPDKQGRVLIPPALCEHGGLKDDVVIIGMQNKLEIWSKARWDEYISQDMDMEAIAEKLAELGM